MQELRNEVRIRAKLVDQKITMVNFLGATVYNEPMSFVDCHDKIYHYADGYSLLLYDNCPKGDLL